MGVAWSQETRLEREEHVQVPASSVRSKGSARARGYARACSRPKHASRATSKGYTFLGERRGMSNAPSLASARSQTARKRAHEAALESTTTLARLRAIGGSIGEFIERQQGRAEGSTMKNRFRVIKKCYLFEEFIVVNAKGEKLAKNGEKGQNYHPLSPKVARRRRWRRARRGRRRRGASRP